MPSTKPDAITEGLAYQACLAVWEDIEICATEAQTDDWRSKELSEETLEKLVKVLGPEWERRRASSVCSNQHITKEADRG